jgi:formylglycine-generating enzyme required for sulfatase activity
MLGHVQWRRRDAGSKRQRMQRGEHMGDYKVCLLFALTSAAIPACGGRVAFDYGDAGAFPPPDPSAKLYREEFGAVLPVPGGITTVGAFDRRGSSITPRPCVYGGDATFSSMRVLVAPFRLMEREVTARAWASCLSKDGCEPPDADLAKDPLPGPWSSPEKADRAVGVGFAAARAFCRRYGGDLPTIGQWSRAGVGDVPTFPVAGLAERQSACLAGSSDPLCPALRSAGFGFPAASIFHSLPISGANAWDIGPYGHRDLHGSAAEWVRGVPRDLSSTCDLVLDATRYNDAEHTDEFAAAPEFMIEYGNNGDGTGIFALAYAPRVDEPQYYMGFRCAFPP